MALGQTSTSRGSSKGHAVVLQVPDLPILPPDLLKFLRSPEPRTLLLTGPPGAGKTTLALSLLAAVDGTSFYISTRVGRGNLLHHFPWLVGCLPPERLIDLEEVRPRSDRQEALLYAMDRLTDTVDPLSAGRRVRDFLNLPEALAKTLGAPPAYQGRRVLYIDSWDGLVEPYVHLLGLDDLGRNSLEHGLLALFQAAGFSLVLCTEGSESTSLAYLADAVIQLRSELVGGGLARSFHIQKLRGVAVERADQPFTLHAARFTYLAPLLPIPNERRSLMDVPPPNTPNPPGKLTLGIPPLDDVVGPFEPGDTLLAELDGPGSSVPLSYLLVPFWIRALRDGRDLVFLMDLAHRPKDLLEGLGAALPGSDLSRRVRTLPLPGRTAKEEVWKDLLEAVRPNTAVDVSTRTLAVLLGEHGEPLAGRIGELGLRAREVGAVLVVVTGSSEPTLPTLSTMVGAHVAIRAHHGSYVIFGRSPPTPGLAVVPAEPSAGGWPMRFVPMV